MENSKPHQKNLLATKTVKLQDAKINTHNDNNNRHMTQSIHTHNKLSRTIPFML